METINTFENGMHADNDFIGQPQGTYRLSVNGNIFLIGKGNFNWAPESGTTEISIPGTGKCIGAITCRDCVVLFFKNDATDLIYEMYADFTYQPLFAGQLGFENDKKIFGYSYYESPEVERVYFSDANTKPKVINRLGISRLKSSTSMVEFKKYLVLTGVITYDGDTFFTGDVFWYYDDTATITFSFGATIIENMEINELDWAPLITYDESLQYTFVNGSLPVAQYFITYRFITHQDHTTPWAPFEKPISVLIKSGAYSSNNDNHGYIKNWNIWKSNTNGFESNQGIQIDISGIRQDKYKYIEFASFRYQTGGLIDAGVIFSRKEIDNLKESFDDTCSVTTYFTSYNGFAISINEYIAQSISLNRIYDLGIIKDINVIAGIEEEDDISMGTEWEQETKTIKPLIQEFPVDVLSAYMDGVDMKDDLPLAGIYYTDENGFIKHGCVLFGQMYEVCSAPIIYDGIHYVPGQYITGNAKRDWTGAGSNLKPVIQICKYEKTSGGYEFEYLPMFNNAFPKSDKAGWLSGYWGDETYRWGILPYSLTGKTLPVRWFKDYKTPLRVPGTKEFYYFQNGILYNGANGELVTVHERESLGMMASVDREFYQTNAKYLSLLFDVDLTDIIDEISGFSIVRSIRDKGKISEGIAEQFFEYINGLGDGSSLFHELFKAKKTNDSVNNSGKKHVNNIYGYVNPENLFKNEINVNEGDIFKNVRILKNYFTKLYYYTPNYYYPNPSESKIEHHAIFRIHKMYESENSSYIVETNVTAKNSIQVLTGDKKIKVKNSPYYLHNFVVTDINYLEEYPTEGNITKCDSGNKMIVLELNENVSWHNDTLDQHQQQVCYIIEQSRGISEYSANIADSEYILCGHYQPITQQFKDDIFYNNKYIAKNIQVYGGDCHISLLMYNRIMPNASNYFSPFDNDNYDDTLKKTVQEFNELIVVPLQTKLNLSLRFGNEANKNGLGAELSRISYSNPKLEDYVADDYDLIMPTGDSGVWEEFSINTAFINDITNIKYPNLTEFASLNKTFRNRIRYSLKKSINEFIDNFTNFPWLNVKDTGGEKGFITNIKTKGDRVYVWHENGMSIIPVAEKAMVSGETAGLIQLGTGEEFARVEEIYKTVGNQDRFGLAETDDGWIWFDYNRKLILSMAFNGKLDQSSVILGLDNFLRTELPERNNLKVFSEYNPRNRSVYMAFIDEKNTANSKIIIINTAINKFTGIMAFTTDYMFKWKDDFFDVGTDEKIYMHNQKDSDTLHGQAFNSSIEFVVGNDNDLLKRFISTTFKTGKNFFEEIKWQATYNDVDETFNNIVTESFDENNFKYIIDEYRAGIPQGDYGRMEGTFMLLTLTSIGSKKLKLMKMITNYNKIF